MEESKVLYKIKSLEKLIIRNFICDKEFTIENINSHPTPTQMQIIEYVLNNDSKAIYQKDLENILGLRRATVSGVLQTMEKNGLLERVIHSEDARTKKIILNDKAKKIYLKNKNKIFELEKTITKNISNEDLTTFLKVLDIMKNNLKQQNINYK